MAYEKRDLTWSLFKNTEKTRDTHSDYQGWLIVNGQEYWLNGWIKEGAKGKFFSGTIKPKNAARTQSGDGDALPSHAPARPPVGRDMDDEIPFAPEWR